MEKLILATPAEMARGRHVFTAWLAASLGVLLFTAWLFPAGPLSPYSKSDAYAIYDAVIRAEIANRSPETQALAPKVEVINRTCPDFYVMEHMAENTVRNRAKWGPSYPLDRESFPAHPAYQLVSPDDWQLDNFTIGLGNITIADDGGYAVLIFANQGTCVSLVLYHVVPSAGGNWQVNREGLTVGLWQPMWK